MPLCGSRSKEKVFFPRFKYNTAGQRVIKKVIPNNSDMPSTTYYIRDASGNIMATYKHYYQIIDIPTNAAEERLAVEEFDIYGSSRLGILNKEVLVASRIGVYTGGTFIPGDPDTYTIEAPLDFELSNQEVGYKNYEITNHLGNVLAVLTDRKVPSVNGSNYDYFNAQITSITDYYPFGMQIEERSWTVSNNYRFGFNGKEKDPEGLGGGGTTYDYGFRIYNPNLGRFLSVDPLTKEYPWYTSYQFAGNKPVWAIDLDGLEEIIYSSKINFGKQMLLSPLGSIDVFKKNKNIICGQQMTDLYFYTYKFGNPVMDNDGYIESIEGSSTGSFGNTMIFLSEGVYDFLTKVPGRPYSQINKNEIKPIFAKGKYVLAIGLTEHYFTKFWEYINDGDFLKAENLWAQLIGTALHEVNAHAMPILNDIKNNKIDQSRKSDFSYRPVDKEHDNYYGKQGTSYIAHKILEKAIGNTQAIKDAKSAKNAVKIEFKLREAYFKAQMKKY